MLDQLHQKQARAMHDGPSYTELKGKRLGAVERGILLSAGSPGKTRALLLKAPRASAPSRKASGGPPEDWGASG